MKFYWDMLKKARYTTDPFKKGRYIVIAELWIYWQAGCCPLIKKQNNYKWFAESYNKLQSL